MNPVRRLTLPVGLIAALSSCSSLAIPYQDAQGGTVDPWSALENSLKPQKAPAPAEPAPTVRSTRDEVLDHAMEIQVGGAVFANFDTVLRFDSEILGVGLPIDFEKNLGFDNKTTVLRWDLKYKLGMRHRFEFSNFAITRRANKKLEKEITIGGETYPINIDVSAALTTNIYKATYRYLFIMDDSWDVSASFGLHTFGLGFDLSEDGTTDKSTSENFTLPLPVIGLGANIAILDNLRITAVAELFGIQIKNFSGYLIDARLNLDWDIWDHVGGGVGWNGFLMDVEVEDKILGGDLLAGSFVYKYQGVLFYLRVFF